MQLALQQPQLFNANNTCVIRSPPSPCVKKKTAKAPTVVEATPGVVWTRPVVDARQNMGDFGDRCTVPQPFRPSAQRPFPATKPQQTPMRAAMRNPLGTTNPQRAMHLDCSNNQKGV
uniref:Uncharacterized protein n=1 Tax=Eutreptiella gymnastica TaxID=73025 RepID=A0A7S4GKR1_9EUGL